MQRKAPSPPTQVREPEDHAIDPQETTPAEERGERLDSGRAIARAGHTDGEVPGAVTQGGTPEATSAEKASGG